MEKSPDIGLRDRLSFLLSHYALLRGELARGMELADIQSINLDGESSNGICPALILILRQGKTNQFGRYEFHNVIILFCIL